MLEALGLAPHEQAVYEVLLTRPHLTVRELEDLAGDSAEAALRRLEVLGLAARLPGDRHTAVPPDTALENLIGERERSLAAARRRIGHLATCYRRDSAREDRPELIEVVQGREEVAARLDELFRRTRVEFLVFDTPPYILEPGKHNPTQSKLLNRGVRCRVIYDRQAVDLRGRLPDIEQSVAAGEQARVTDLPMKLGIGDGGCAMLPLCADPVSLETWLVVHHPVLVKALAALFDTYWARAVPLHVKRDRPDGAAIRADHDVPDETDRALLSLLTAGLTDRAIADHLGWHERTAHRHLRAMMRRLDAATRFQAGYQAVRRGWLSIPDETADDLR